MTGLDAPAERRADGGPAPLRGDRFGGRRRFLVAVTTVAAAPIVAGCGGDGSTGDGMTLPVEPEYGSWFDGVGNYANTIDRRGTDATTVLVGVRANGGYLGFGPAAVAVDPGTTVTWDWTGRGGAHDVAAENGAFDSGPPVRAGDTTFEYRFDAPGVYRYVCTPHRGLGMRGAVFVALE